MNMRDYRSKIYYGNFRKGRIAWGPGLIVLHTTEGSYEGSCNWFCNPKSGVSANFVVHTNGNVTYCVDIGDTAYANGTTFSPSDNRYYGKATNPIVKKRNANANFYSVSIEVVGNYDSKLDKCTMTSEQKSAVVEIILFILREVKKRYNNDIPVDRTRICGHYEVNPITKPFCGKGFPYDEIIKEVIKLKK